MENASKALIMVASVLIGIMILSLGGYLFSKFGNTSKQVNQRLEQKQIDEFNAQFTKYEGTTCTIHDIVTIINLAKSNNKNYYTDQEINTFKNSSDKPPYYITVTINGITNSGQKQELSESEIVDLIKNNSVTYEADGTTKTINFECQAIEINEVSKRVQKITFKKVE